MISEIVFSKDRKPTLAAPSLFPVSQLDRFKPHSNAIIEWNPSVRKYGTTGLRVITRD